MSDTTEIDKLLETEEGKLEYYTTAFLLSIADLVGSAMRNSAVSAEQLAAKIGKKPSYVTRLMSASLNPTVKDLVKIFVALGYRLHPTMYSCRPGLPAISDIVGTFVPERH